MPQTYVRHHPRAVAAVPLRAALHDHPVPWACDPRNRSTTRLRPAASPAAATVRRRARRPGFEIFPGLSTRRLRGSGPPAWEPVFDGEAPVVGPCGKGPDARRGRVPRGSARGDTLHALGGTSACPSGGR